MVFDCVVLQIPDTWTRYLHDAVYLYLRIVHQMLSEGFTDYRDGRVILKKSAGHRFRGVY